MKKMILILAVAAALPMALAPAASAAHHPRGFPFSFSVTSATLSVRLVDAVHYRGRVSHAKADEIHCKEMFDAILQRSEEAFPASTTGL